jgi:hypothetical protein
MDVRTALGPTRVQAAVRENLAALLDYLGAGRPADAASVLDFLLAGGPLAAQRGSVDFFLLAEELASRAPRQGLKLLEAGPSGEPASSFERRVIFLGWVCGFAAHLAGASGAEAASGGRLSGLIFEAKLFQEGIAALVTEKEVLLWHALRAAEKARAGDEDRAERELEPARLAAGRILETAAGIVSRLPEALRREYEPLVARGLEILGSGPESTQRRP